MHQEDDISTSFIFQTLFVRCASLHSDEKKKKKV